MQVKMSVYTIKDEIAQKLGYLLKQNGVNTAEAFEKIQKLDLNQTCDVCGRKVVAVARFDNDCDWDAHILIDVCNECLRSILKKVDEATS